MDVTSLFTNIPQEEGIEALLKQALRLILRENSFQFNGKNYLQTHGTAMGSKMSVAFANIFMAKVETDILRSARLEKIHTRHFFNMECQ